MIALVVVIARGDGSTAAEEALATGGSVKIPLQELASGEAKFYTYDVAGEAVKFFIMKSPDGKYRAAFDASEECAPFKKGFRQEGNDMVCNKCLQRFASTTINVLKGACNPSSIDRKVQGEDLVLKTADLERGVSYFR